ncbi:MAG: ExbD/TolR family protein [Terriglobales bacterium]
MKSLQLFAAVLAITSVGAAQNSARPLLRQGVSVEMPVANHAVAMQPADEENATIVSLTEDGQIFIGGEAADTTKLHHLKANPVYVKADARVPYQSMLSVLDALHGRQVVLLTAPAAKSKTAGVVPPYGLKLRVADK